MMPFSVKNQAAKRTDKGAMGKAHRTLESENWDRMTDNVLNSALSGLLPFLQHHSARTLADALLERLSTHLATELHYIRTGKHSDGLGEYTSAKTFRNRFVEMGGKLR
jgi:hypothetical protein